MFWFLQLIIMSGCTRCWMCVYCFSLLFVSLSSFTKQLKEYHYQCQRRNHNHHQRRKPNKRKEPNQRKNQNQREDTCTSSRRISLYFQNYCLSHLLLLVVPLSSWVSLASSLYLKLLFLSTYSARIWVGWK